MKNDPKNSLPIELSEESYRKLEVIALEQGRNISDLLEDLLEDHIANTDCLSD
jgi:hypothetical protein